MPTTRPRHVLTETDELRRILDDAAERWPEERGNRTGLLRRLVVEGHSAVGRDLERRASDQRDAVARTGGLLTGSYGDEYLADLREDWPA